MIKERRSDHANADLNARIARRVRELRAARGGSLDALARSSGVSRSMISLVERGEASPTAVVLEKLASGLGVTLATLFDPPEQAARSVRGPLARRDEQVEWRDPASGYVRRNVSPPHAAARIQIVEVRFPPGARVAFENATGDARVHQQVWLLDGAMHMRVGDALHELRAGDCLAMQLDQPTLFHNPTRKTARYAVVIAGAGSEQTRVASSRDAEREATRTGARTSARATARSTTQTSKQSTVRSTKRTPQRNAVSAGSRHSTQRRDVRSVDMTTQRAERGSRAR